jgi:rhodanese-related sulfurtransferase
MKTMNGFIKITILLLASIVLTSCTSEDRKKYAVSTNDALEAYISKKDILSVEKVANILLCKHDHIYRMIDLRTPHEFAQGHIKDAINIPAKNVLDMDYYDLFNQDEKINVLYCRGKNQAINIYMILNQLGFKNIKVALGGYDYLNEYVVQQYGVKSGDYDDEKPKYDFLRLIAGVDVPKQDSIASPEFDQKNSKKIVRDFDEECPDLN